MIKQRLLFGLRFDDLDMADTLDEIGRCIESGSSQHWSTANVDFLTRARYDWEFHQALAQCERILCDSGPLRWLSRHLGSPLRARVTGSDLTRIVLDEGTQRGWRIFLLGVNDGVLEACARKAGACVVGCYAPPYSPLEQWDHEEIVDRVTAVAPDILLVALSSPKPELWLQAFRWRLRVPVMIGIGAALEFYVNQVTRAPARWQRLGLEWFYRLLQEPRRLWRRYGQNGLFMLRHLPFEWAAQRRGLCGQTGYFTYFQTFEPGECFRIQDGGGVGVIEGELTGTHLSTLEADSRQQWDAGRLQRADLQGRLWIQRQHSLKRMRALPAWWVG